jgi:hypothetical protein
LSRHHRTGSEIAFSEAQIGQQKFPADLFAVFTAGLVAEKSKAKSTFFLPDPICYG